MATGTQNQAFIQMKTLDDFIQNEIFERKYDDEFWNKVEKRYKNNVARANERSADTDDRLWDKSVDEIRAERIKRKYSRSGKDPVVAIMKDWVKKFKEKYKGDETELKKQMPDFQNEVARLVCILIDKECKTKHCANDKHECKYGGEIPHIFTDPQNSTEKTLLHIAAEEGLYILMLELMSRFSNLLLVKTFGTTSQLPVVLALKGGHDDVASAIIKTMGSESVRDVFESDVNEQQYSFKDIIKKPNMKKTVVAVLDSLVTPVKARLVNPYNNELKISNVSDEPTRYHFSYRILDGDNKGRSGKNESFNYGSESCFKLLLQSSYKETIIRHPVMRLLAKSKWDKFGKWLVRSYAFIFVLYLVALSVGLLGAVNSNNPLLYKTSFDYFRGFCEGVTLLGAMVYLLLEIVQLAKERFNYFYDVHNFSDACGILLIFAVVLLRCLNLDSQWTVAAFAYLVNFFRMFKYFPAWKTVGLYSTVFVQMFLYDFTKFLFLYLFVMLSFAGSILLALKTTSGNTHVGAVVILLLFVNMLMIAVMLVNMLIAQLSYRYEYAQERAALLYDISKCLIVAKIERSWFKRFNLRVKHYEDGETVLADTELKGRARSVWQLVWFGKLCILVGTMATGTQNQAFIQMKTLDDFIRNELFERKYDDEFWKKVEERYKNEKQKRNVKSDGADTDDRLWNRSIDEIRAERISEKYSDSGKDPVVAIMKDWIKTFIRKYKNNESELKKQIPDFQHEECVTSECAKEEHKCKYGGESPNIFIDKDGKTKKTILHIAAEDNLYILILELMNRFSKLLYLETFDGEKHQLPVELALERGHDDVASAIIKKWTPRGMLPIVRDLFEFDTMKESCIFSFGDIIKKNKMKKTVVAVLGTLVTPVRTRPVKDELKSSNTPHESTRYHFSYQILDGDDKGRSANKSKYDFNHGSESCFKLLLQSSLKETIIRHPVIRLLAKSKWDKFGKCWIRSYAFIFVLYLLALSIGLLAVVNLKDPLLYKTNFDYFRGLCEGVTLLGTMVYLILEIVQLSKERFGYFYDVHNFSDVCGILLIFALVPLRCLRLKSQWTVAAFAYLVNFFRILKYFPAWKTVGLYSKVLLQMCLYDFTKFALVYLFVMFSFAGSIFLALKATNDDGHIGHFHDAILIELRGFVEGQAFDSYKVNAVIIILLFMNMLIVTLMLVNMLIAQLSYRYEDAQEKAELLYDINKCLIVAKIEHSRFKIFNLRVKHYEEGETVLVDSELKEIFDVWKKVEETLKTECLPGMENRT
eukprot:gene20479-22495_t